MSRYKSMWEGSEFSRLKLLDDLIIFKFLSLIKKIFKKAHSHLRVNLIINFFILFFLVTYFKIISIYIWYKEFDQ